MKKAKKEENIWNVPNILTFIRVIIAFVTIYFIFSGAEIKLIVYLFVFGMLTDFLDGQIARRFNQKTEFGRKFDMVADRFLMIGVALAFAIDLLYEGLMSRKYLLQIIMLLSREIIAAPVSFIAFTSRKPIPRARLIGKATTVLQAISFPLIILRIYYGEAFAFSAFFVLVTFIVGTISGFFYINDVVNSEAKK